ncbi:gp51 [Bacillus phage G]|uniref:Gp51 n=1 Tax=Bacillus phage G TaxID=2884420 RepID=G3MBC1_9CAUD|nr:gp51 [Bacillus phage G]AEO93322.1 gp51 [Bacillus phage G]
MNKKREVELILEKKNPNFFEIYFFAKKFKLPQKKYDTYPHIHMNNKTNDVMVDFNILLTVSYRESSNIYRIFGGTFSLAYPSEVSREELDFWLPRLVIESEKFILKNNLS